MAPLDDKVSQKISNKNEKKFTQHKINALYYVQKTISRLNACFANWSYLHSSSFHSSTHLIKNLKWAIPASFYFIFVFSKHLTVNKCSIEILPMTGFEPRTTYQWSHNHCPNLINML